MFYERLQYPINKTAVSLDLTDNSHHPILNIDALLALVQWCKTNSDRSISGGSDGLEQTYRKRSPSTNEHSGRNGMQRFKACSKNERGK